MRRENPASTRRLFALLSAITILMFFLPACFKLGGESSIDAEFTLTREISIMGISEFAFSVDVKGVKDAAVVEFDNGIPSVALSGGKAESRFFANVGAGEVTLLVRDSRGVELLKKTVALPETKSKFDVAAVEDKTGIYVLIDGDLIFYSLECLENMTFAEKVELLVEVLSVNDSYVIIDTPPFGAWIWDFATYPANPKYDLTLDTLDTLGLPNNALGFCEASLFNVLNGRFLYGLGVVIEGNGLVVVAPEETIYEEGTEVSLTAEPAEGWLFEKWTGDATGSDTAIVITMDSDKTITASFKLERYTVAFFVSNSEGSVEGALVSFAGEERETDAQGNAEFYEISPGSKDYTITKLGYEDLAGNVIVDSDKTVDIVLAYKTYELTTLVSGEGSISRSIEKERYNHGEIVELTAISASGWNFGGWTGDLEGSLNPTQITMDDDKTVTANFVEHQYFVEVYASPENGGAVSGGGAYSHGEEALLTAEASECYMFSGWYENGQLVSEDQEYRFDVFNDRVLEARFVVSVLSKDFKFILESAFFGCKYEVRLELDTAITKVRFIYPDIDPAIQTPIPEEAIPDENGIVDLSAFWTNRDAQAVMIVCYVGDEVVSQCEAVLSKENLAEFEITFNVSDESGSMNGAVVDFNGESLQTDSQGRAVFSEVTVGNRAYTVSKTGYENSTGSVNVDSDKSVNVSLVKKTYTLSTNTVGQGSVSRNPDKSTYTHGEIVQLTAIPSTGWSFSSWSGDQAGSVNPASITMNSNKTITANFLINQYSIAVSSSPSAGGTASGGGVYNHGQTVNLVASANMGYEFVNWTENGVQVSANTTYSFTATGNRTLVANFRLKTYTITATAGAGGSINPSGNVNVTHGSNQTFSIATDSGYEISDVKVDNVSVGKVGSYTFNNVTANHSIQASFSLLPVATYTVTFNVNDVSEPLQGANVSFNGESLQTDSQGRAVFSEVPVGNRAYTVSKTGYENSTGSVSVDSDESVNVSLAKKTYTFSTNTVGQGSVSKNPDKSTYTHGEIVQLTPIPSTGWSFSSWSGYVSGIENPVAVIVEGNGTVTATFEPLPFDITFSVKDAEGLPLQGATVLFNGQTKNTASCGCATFDGVLAGDKTYSVTKTGYHNSSGSVVVDSDKTVNVVLNVASDDGVDIDGPVYSGNRLLVSNESTSDNTTQYTGTLPSFADLSVYTDIGLDIEAYRINPVLDFDPGDLNHLDIRPDYELSAVGDTRQFWVFNFVTQRDYQITATLQAIGDKALVWAEDTTTINTSRAQQIAGEFDSVMHSLVVENFYSPSDVNGDGKVAILCFDIVDGFTGSGGYYAGYFWSKDLYPRNGSNPYSNEMEIFYIDTYPLMEYPRGSPVDVTRSYSTIVHEFQHMVNHNRNVFVESGSSMKVWLNEGLSMAAEHIYGGVQTGRISFFNNSTAIRDGKSLIRWEQTLADYSLNYLFLQYIRTQMGIGNSIFKEILLDTANDYRAVENVVKKYISPSKTFGEFMTDFRLALLLKKPTGPYGFMGESCFNSVSPLLYTGTGKNLYGGGALYKSIAGSFEDPGDAGASIQYAGITLE
ncbi:exported hypothetical protein [Mesotoga infera]|nr:exported hypothetical protein [Mesotoga infera]